MMATLMKPGWEEIAVKFEEEVIEERAADRAYADRRAKAAAALREGNPDPAIRIRLQEHADLMYFARFAPRFLRKAALEEVVAETRKSIATDLEFLRA